MSESGSRQERQAPGAVFWKIAGAGATFQAGSSAVDSATVVASLVFHLTGNVFAVGAASAILRLGWLLPQLVVGFLAQRAARRTPYYIFGAFGRAICLAVIGTLLWFGAGLSTSALAAGFLVLWTIYAFVSGVVAVPYNDIVGRSIPSGLRSRMLAWRFFGGGVLALAGAAVIHEILGGLSTLPAYGAIFVLAAALMILSSGLFVSAGEPPLGVAQKKAPYPGTMRGFLKEGWKTLRSDTRFRLFLYSQWLGGATLMALPFYVIAASRFGIATADIAVLLGAQTAGSLASNPIWGRIGDARGKLRLLQSVGFLRLLPPLVVLIFLSVDIGIGIAGFVVLFFLIGALVNGVTIGYLGYLFEISPDDRRPAYSAYFNVLASPAALLPLAGAGLVHFLSIESVFGAAVLAAVVQLGIFRRLSRVEP